MSSSGKPRGSIDFRIKITLIGDSGVGKSCLASQFAKGKFDTEQASTVADIISTSAVVAGRTVVFNIWDTAGQERFRSLMPLYLRDVRGAVLVYDVTDRSTFEHLPSWLSDLRKYTATCNTKIVVAGNKVDMEDIRAVDSKRAETFALANGLTWLETSAKTGENVQQTFFEIAKQIIDEELGHVDHTVGTEWNTPMPSVVVCSTTDPERRTGCCKSSP